MSGDARRDGWPALYFFAGADAGFFAEEGVGGAAGQVNANSECSNSSRSPAVITHWERLDSSRYCLAANS
jgi:hypothetical protein